MKALYLFYLPGVFNVLVKNTAVVSYILQKERSNNEKVTIFIFCSA